MKEDKKVLRFTTKNTEKFKMLVNALVGVVNEVALMSNDEGITCSSIDSANVAHISFDWRKEDFEEYESPAGGHKFVVQLEKLKQSLKRAKASDLLNVEVGHSTMQLVLDDGATKRTFQLGIIGDNNSTKPLPSLTFKSKVILPSEKWIIGVEDVAEIGTSCSIKAEEGLFSIQTWNDNKVQTTKIDYRDGEAGTELHSEVYGDGSTGKYSVEYLKHFLEPAKKTDGLVLEWSKDYPCRITYELENLTIRYVLAPRIE